MNQAFTSPIDPAVPTAFEVRRAQDRGTLKNDWLEARFSFSFGAWRAPGRDRFGPLLALNEDVVQPGTGFAMHPHQDLEIFILPRAGVVEHRDSQGRQALVTRGELQMMRAGSGIRHSQMNPSRDTPDRHLQIWIEPRRRGLASGVAQRRFGEPAEGGWTLLASPDGAACSLVVDQDTRLSIGAAGPGRPLRLDAAPGRSRYLHLLDGESRMCLGDHPPLRLRRGDAVALYDAALPVVLEADAPVQWLGFELPPVGRDGQPLPAPVLDLATGARPTIRTA